MSHPFFTKYNVTATTPVIFGKVSTSAARAVWGGEAKSEKGIVGPGPGIGPGYGDGGAVPPIGEGPVDPNHPTVNPNNNQTPVQTLDGEDPIYSQVTSREIALTFEVPAGDYEEGTTTGIIIPAWATGDQSNNTRQVSIECVVNGVSRKVMVTETIGATGWELLDLDLPDGTIVDIQIKGTAQTVGPPDAFGNRKVGPASEYTMHLSGEVSGGMASGALGTDSTNGRLDIRDAQNGPSENGVNMTGGGEPGGISPVSVPIPKPDTYTPRSGARIIATALRMGWPREPYIFEQSFAGGGLIITEDFTNWPPPGIHTWVWSAIFTGQYDGEGQPIYTYGPVDVDYYSVGINIWEWYYVGGPADPDSPNYTPPEYGELDLGGPVTPAEGTEIDLTNFNGNLKDGIYVPPPLPEGPEVDPPNNAPRTPDVTTPVTVPLPIPEPDQTPEADTLPMEEYPLTKDIVIHTTVTGNIPTETSTVPDGKDVLLDYTGFSFVSGDGYSIDETVTFKYLPLNARVEDQPESVYGFYTAVVGPFTGARFLGMVDDKNAKLHLYYDGSQQPFILFRKMPTRAAQLTTSTLSFRDMQSQELTRDVTVDWSVDLPVPFGLGYEYDAASLPGRILSRKMQSPNEPNMETELNVNRYDFDECPPMTWEYAQTYKSRISNGNVLVWQSTISHTISFA